MRFIPVSFTSNVQAFDMIIFHIFLIDLDAEIARIEGVDFFTLNPMMVA